MQKNTSILDELKGWDSALANVSRQMPFVVPERYFENAFVLNPGEEAALETVPVLKGQSGSLPYDVPAGYFNWFPEHVLDTIRNEELAEPLSPGVQAKAMPFELPGNYFENLSTAILDEIKNEAQINFNAAPVDGFEVPEHYFDTFSTTLLNRIKEESAKENIELSVQAKAMPYTVPAMYFENLSTVLSAKVVPVKNKTISIPFWKSVQLAAAAMLVLFLGVGMYRTALQQPKQVSENYNLTAALDMVPKETIKDYIQYNIDDFDSELIVAHIDKRNIADIAASKVKDLERRDIISYLDETGWEL